MSNRETAAAGGAVRSTVTLPAQYGEALDLANAMLTAARYGDWPTVAALRRTLPGLARQLNRRWAEIGKADRTALQGLEAARIDAIRRVLAVDEQIRRLSSGHRVELDRLLRGVSATRKLN